MGDISRGFCIVFVAVPLRTESTLHLFNSFIFLSILESVALFSIVVATGSVSFIQSDFT